MCAMPAMKRDSAPTAEPEAKRYKIRFPEAEAVVAASSIEGPSLHALVKSEKRRLWSVEQPSWMSDEQFQEKISVYQGQYGASVVPDFRYDLEMQEFEFEFLTESTESDPSLDDVLRRIEARRAWEVSTGENVTIAIVDTGITGSRAEFPEDKRGGAWQPEGDDAWTDYEGHGSMCGCIAAATKKDGGVFQGVAPGSKIMSCKTSFYDSELADIYDTLTEKAQAGETIVASNSFGLKTGIDPAPDPDSDFVPALEEAIAAGVMVFFSAGNYHELANGNPAGHEPNSIWLHKSRDDVMVAGTCDLEGSMWEYSSRGPGQHYLDEGTNSKPDVSAPTPRNGRILYGTMERSLPRGWGTSSACPQVAGLAALLLSRFPDLERRDLFEIIREGARDLGHHRYAQGAGMIDCQRAMSIAAG